jgi:hypothetical protein
VEEREQASGPVDGKRRCKAQNKRGEPCGATIVGPDGYCTAHDPERKVDMRELGRRGGTAHRRGVVVQLPAPERLSLRETLRDDLDHELVMTAIERALAGSNESARVAAVKFLADLELYRKDGDECPECARRKSEEKVAPLEIDPEDVIRGLEEIGLVKRSLPPEVPRAQTRAS